MHSPRNHSPHGPDRPRGPAEDPIATGDGGRRHHTAAISGIVVVLGGWIALAGVVYNASATGLVYFGLAGTTIAGPAAYNAIRQYADVPASVAASVLVTLCSLFLVASSFWVSLPASGHWSVALTGVVIATLAGYVGYGTRERQTVA